MSFYVKSLTMFMLLTVLPATIATAEEDSEALRIAVENLLQTGQLHIGDVDIASGELLAEFYERRNYAPAWAANDKVAELLQLVMATEKDGLDPSDYHLDAVRNIQSSLAAGRISTAVEIANADLILTDSLIRLGYHQRFGKVNPYSLDPHWNFHRELNGKNPAVSIQEAFDADSFAGYMETVFPRGWVYMQLRDGLARYREIVAKGGWPEIPDGPTLRPGATDSRLATLLQRLTISGDMEGKQSSAQVTEYDEGLQAGVRHFQVRHGLDADAIIGPATIKALNFTAEQRVRQLEINLERARWVLDDISDDFILVNIAGFRVYLMRDRQIAWESKVQVGKTYHQSPVFRDEMKYLVFNPTWTVPYSIASKEMLPAIQADPEYFQKRDFDVKNRNGELIDPTTVDWSSVTRRNFGYTLVQRPGPANALGRVKFMFPNKHAVYLHDTPSKYLFEKSERAFSHGCIRVEHPYEFAEILLGPDWDQDRIKATLDTEEITTVSMPKSLPVLLLYWTAVVSQNGDVFFYNDVYQRDQNISAALDEPFRIELPDS